MKMKIIAYLMIIINNNNKSVCICVCLFVFVSVIKMFRLIKWIICVWWWINRHVHNIIKIGKQDQQIDTNENINELSIIFFSYSMCIWNDTCTKKL